MDDATVQDPRDAEVSAPEPVAVAAAAVAPLADELALLESEVAVADGPRLLELAAREYEILEEISRPWRRQSPPAAPPTA